MREVLKTILNEIALSNATHKLNREFEIHAKYDGSWLDTVEISGKEMDEVEGIRLVRWNNRKTSIIRTVEDARKLVKKFV